jgi:hypothetical protein
MLCCKLDDQLAVGQRCGARLVASASRPIRSITCISPRWVARAMLRSAALLSPTPSCRSCSAHKRKRPGIRCAPKFNRSEPQAATLVGLTSRSLLELAIAPDFIPSGISRTRWTVGARPPARAKAARDLCRATSGRTAGVLRFHSSLEGLTDKGALCSGTAVSSFIQTRLGHRT